MSDSESDGEEAQQIEHYTGPIEDAWKMKIPEFKADDNPNGLICVLSNVDMSNILIFCCRNARRKLVRHTLP